MFEGPEKKFQRHIAEYFICEHQYAVLEQDEITDTEYYFAEDHLIAFLKATQKETFESLETDYGTDARDEIFKALKDELRISPLWLIIRQGEYSGRTKLSNLIHEVQYVVRVTWQKITNRCPPASPELATRPPSPITAYTTNAGMRGNGGQAPGRLREPCTISLSGGLAGRGLAGRPESAG